MNYALAKEIYGDAWCIDFGSVPTFKKMLRGIRTAVTNPVDKANTFALVKYSIAGNSVSGISASSSSKTDKVISVTNINGVITKSGGASSYGMKDLSDQLMEADNDPNVTGHLFVVDSPGGSVSGMKYMQQTMEGLKKPTVSLIERSGMAASAAYGIASHANYMFAEDANSEVGSIGVIAGAAGVPNGDKNAEGEVEYMIYASTSPDKNKAQVDAINDGDTSGLQDRADQLHTEFKATTKSRRANILDGQMTGGMYRAGDVIGTMVDAIGSQQDAIAKLNELSLINQQLTINPNNTAMTTAELKAQHPNTYNEILGIGVAAGVEAEKDRAGSWLAHLSTDPETVKKGIESGGEITATVRETLLVKANANAALAGLQKDSAGKLVVPEGGAVAEPTEAEAFYATIQSKLIKK